MESPGRPGTGHRSCASSADLAWRPRTALTGKNDGFDHVSAAQLKADRLQRREV